MLLLPLLLSVPILGTTQNEVKLTQLQPHEGHRYSQGTSNAAIQPEFFSPVCRTKRLVFSLPPHQLGPSKVYIEPDLNSYNFELDTFIQHPTHITNALLFGTLLHSTTTSMTTSQYLVYNTFAWSICLLHFQVTSATETLSKFTMFDCGSAQTASH